MSVSLQQCRVARKESLSPRTYHATLLGLLGLQPKILFGLSLLLPFPGSIRRRPYQANMMSRLQLLAPFVLLALSSCGTLQVYPGPSRPKNEVAMIQTGGHMFRIVSIRKHIENGGIPSVLRSVGRQ